MTGWDMAPLGFNDENTFVLKSKLIFLFQSTIKNLLRMYVPRTERIEKEYLPRGDLWPPRGSLGSWD